MGCCYVLYQHACTARSASHRCCAGVLPCGAVCPRVVRTAARSRSSTGPQLHLYETGKASVGLFVYMCMRQCALCTVAMVVGCTGRQRSNASAHCVCTLVLSRSAKLIMGKVICMLGSISLSYCLPPPLPPLTSAASTFLAWWYWWWCVPARPHQRYCQTASWHCYCYHPCCRCQE